MRTSFAERLAMALAKDPRLEKEVAAALGVSGGQLSRWKTGATSPTADTVAKLCDVLQINGHWLLTNQGPMELSDDMEPLRLQVIGRVVDGEIPEPTLRALLGELPTPAELVALQEQVAEIERSLSATKPGTPGGSIPSGGGPQKHPEHKRGA